MAKQNERFDWQASERKRNTHNKKPLAFEIVWRIKCLSRYLDVSRANTIYQTFKCDKMNGILSAVCKAMGMELPIRNPLKSCCHWCCCYFFKIHCHKMKMKNSNGNAIEFESVIQEIPVVVEPYWTMLFSSDFRLQLIVNIHFVVPWPWVRPAWTTHFNSILTLIFLDKLW